MAFVFALDNVAEKIGPQKPDGTINHTEAVTFRGWLGAGVGAGDTNYRFYTSPWFEQWLELTEGDIIHHQPSPNPTDASIIWVKAEAKIIKCRLDKACHFAEKEIDDPDDPTLSARIPKY